MSYYSVARLFALCLHFARASSTFYPIVGRQRDLFAAGSWYNIFFEDFEQTTSELIIVGDSVAEYEMGEGAVSGTKTIQLRHDGGVASSLVTKSIDAAPFTQVEVSFAHLGENFEQGDLFMVEFQYNEEGPWYLAKDLVSGVGGEIENGQWKVRTMR
jgi:hypothetical protein